MGRNRAAAGIHRDACSRTIPLNCTCCQGCFTVSSRGMNYLWPLINKEKKPLLLWSFVSKQS
ncbi:MAG: hypothetical protein K6D37_01750 [Prevotella sp.]|nr:hypothetical protein [Prevotella sp.]